jgi:drug/metabolite transporter (DMT)-like permease
VFFALTMVLFRREAKSGGGDALPSTTLGNLLAAALTLPWAVKAAPAMLSAQGAGVLLYLGIVQLGLAYFLFVRGVRHVPAAEASLISMLEPVLNPVWVLIGFGERPGPWAIVGGAIVIAAVLVRTLVPPQRASTTSV